MSMLLFLEQKPYFFNLLNSPDIDPVLSIKIDNIMPDICHYYNRHWHNDITVLYLYYDRRTIP